MLAGGGAVVLGGAAAVGLPSAPVPGPAAGGAPPAVAVN